PICVETSMPTVGRKSAASNADIPIVGCLWLPIAFNPRKRRGGDYQAWALQNQKAANATATLRSRYRKVRFENTLQ
ncbi:hypothetical protein OAH50_00795, partial [bacterium]|nr:hypothetical protein [bacterium]